MSDDFALAVTGAEREVLTYWNAFMTGVHVPFAFVRICGGDWQAAAMLAQILYWFRPDRNGQDKTTIVIDGLRYVAKRHAQWEDLALSEFEAKRAAAKLASLGLLDIEHRQFDGMRTCHYRPRFDALVAAIGPAPVSVIPPTGGTDSAPTGGSIFAPTGERGIAPTGGTDSAPTIKRKEITAETTAKKIGDAKASRRTRRAEPSASPRVDAWAPLKDAVLSSFGVPATASNFKQAQKAVGAAQANGLDGERGAKAWAAFVGEQKAGDGWQFARLHSVGALFGKWIADTLERRGQKAARSQVAMADPEGAPAGWRGAVYFDHDGALKVRDPQLVLPRFGIDRNAPLTAWPAWLREVYRGTVYA